MRVLIAGGTGFIGRALIPQLAQGGHQIIVLTRRPAAATRSHLNTTVVGWDGGSSASSTMLASWADVMNDVDAVVNLAGESIGAWLWTPKRKRAILGSREAVGRALSEAIAQADRRPTVLIQASGVGYYGPHGDEPLDETSPPGDTWQAQVAVRWEASTQPVEALGVRRVIVRSGLVLGPEGGLLTRLMLPFRLYVGGRMGTGTQVMSWIHIEDEARAIRFLLERSDARGPFNLTAPNPVTNAAFSNALGSAMGRPAWFPVPAWLLRLALGQMSGLVLSGQKVLPRRLETLGFDFTFRHLSDALASILTT